MEQKVSTRKEITAMRMATMKRNDTFHLILEALNSRESHLKSWKTQKKAAPFSYLIRGRLFKYAADACRYYKIHKVEMSRLLHRGAHGYYEIEPIPDLTHKIYPRGIKYEV